MSAQKSESNGWQVKNYTEAMAKAYLDQNSYLDDIEGIWQSSDGYKYAIEKDYENNQRSTDKFRVVILESGFDGWATTEVKAFISNSSLDGLYSMKYYTKRADGTHLQSQNILLALENPLLATFTTLSGDKISLLKLYPKVEADDSEASSYSSSDTHEQQWSGSSVVIGSKYLATNFHVVDGAKTLVVSGVDGNFNIDYDAEAICVDKYNDLAILKITDPRFGGFKAPKYGLKTSTAAVGTDVFVLGYPLITTMGEEIKLTTGVVSSKTGFQGDVSLYQISAPVQPGNSGGPLFDGSGNLIGIVNAKHNGAENVGYAIKLSYLKNLIESVNDKIEFNYANSISSFSLSEKVKQISPYVLLVKANVKEGSSNVTPKVTAGSSTNNRNYTNSDKSNAQKCYNSAIQHFKAGEIRETYEDVCKSVDFYPTVESHNLRGYLALNYSGDYEAAEESFKFCIANEYEVESSYGYLGSTLMNLGRFEEGIEVANKILQINRRNIDAYFTRGFCKSKLDDHSGAIADYQQGLKFEGLVESEKWDIGTIYNNIAYQYVTMGEYNKAVSPIAEALKRNHTEWFIWDTDGELKYKTGDYAGCETSMTNAIVIKNNADNSLLYRGLARIELGKIADGYTDLEKASDYGNGEASKELAKLDAAQIDFSKTVAYDEIYKNISITKSDDQDAKILAVETTEEFTAVYMSWTNRQYDNGAYYIDKDAYIRDKKTGKRLQIIKTENCNFAPNKSQIDRGETAQFVLYFPAISKNSREIDLIESDSSKWKFYGIKLK